MRGAIAILVVLLSGGSAFAQSVLVLDDLPPGEHYIKVTVTATGTTARVVKALRIGDAPAPTPDPPVSKPTSEFAKKVETLVRSVPKHDSKDDIRQALAASYLALAKKWRDGEIESVERLLAVRESAHSLWVSQLDGGDNWDAFDAELRLLLRQYAATPDQVADAFEDIAAGLTSGEFLNPELITIAIELIDVLVNRPEGEPIKLADLLPIVLKAIKIFLARSR